ncbi:hypothetical protein D3C80_1619340 [compost metagenome]
MPKDCAGQIGRIDISLRLTGTVIGLQVGEADIIVQSNRLHLAQALQGGAAAQQREAIGRIGC